MDSNEGPNYSKGFYDLTLEHQKLHEEYAAAQTMVDTLRKRLDTLRKALEELGIKVEPPASWT